jgi:PST family polysaccharide transporter
LKYILKIIGSNKVLFKNFTSLSLLQLANYLFPLITLPYLVRVLGPDKYGLVNFATAFAAYFVIITDYGFNLTATQDISVHRNDRKRVSQIFSTVYSIKVILYLLSSVLFVGIILLFNQFQENVGLYIITFIGALGTTLFPIWYFQGVEKMNYILIINVSVRAILTILIFLLIKIPNDFLLFAGLNSSAFFITAIIGFIVITKSFKTRFVLPKKSQIVSQLKSGWNIFLSTVWINLYTTSNAFILGLFAPTNIVGYYTAADKIRMAFQGILSTMSQSVFPYVNKIVNESYERFIRFNKKLLKIAAAVGIIISLSLFFFADKIVVIVLGDQYTQSIIVLKIIAWLPLIIFLSNVFGIQTMLPLNKQKNFSTILFFAAIINIVLSFTLVPKYFEIGTSISVLITEVFVTLSFFIFIKKEKINLI